MKFIPWLFVLMLLHSNTPSIAQTAPSTNLDYGILLELAEDRTEEKTELWSVMSKINNPVCMSVPVSAMLVGVITHNKDLKKKALYMAESFVVNSVITTAMKVTFDRPRPFVNNSSLVPVYYLKHYSFPSGHTSEAFSMATSLSLSFPKWYVIVPSYAFASMVGYSRVYLGVHFPSDVIAGALVGTGSAWLTYKVNQWLHKDRHQLKKSPLY